MKVETQHLEDHQVKLTIEANPEELNDARRRAARKLAQRVKIPGFRPGKAPYAVVEKHLGPVAILEDAIDILAHELYPKALDESGVQPYGPGRLENIPSMDPPRLEFIVPLEAEVVLGDYRSVRIPYELEAVSETEINEYIDTQRGRHAIIEPVERPAQEGDQVTIHLRGDRLDAEDDENPEVLSDRSLPVVVRKPDSDNREEWPYPGFSQELIGLSTGDEKTVEYTYPQDSIYESLRGKQVEFKIGVEKVAQRTLPVLDEEYLKTIESEAQNLEAYREEVRQRLTSFKEQEYNEAYDDKVINAFTEQATVKYPPQMVERELDDMLEDLQGRVQQQGLDMDTYLRIVQKDRDSLRSELRESAIRRMIRSLVLFEFTQQEHLTVDPAEIETEAQQTLGALASQLPEKEMRKYTGRNAVQNLVGNLMLSRLTRKAVEQMRSTARGLAQAAPTEVSPADQAQPADVSASTASSEATQA